MAESTRDPNIQKAKTRPFGSIFSHSSFRTRVEQAILSIGFDSG